MKTKIIIEIETSNLKPFIEDGEDYKEQQEEEWHDIILKVIEDKVQSDDFENEVMEFWATDGDSLNPKAKEFSDIGNLMIAISQLKEAGK